MPFCLVALIATVTGRRSSAVAVEQQDERHMTGAAASAASCAGLKLLSG